MKSAYAAKLLNTPELFNKTTHFERDMHRNTCIHVLTYEAEALCCGCIFIVQGYTATGYQAPTILEWNNLSSLMTETLQFNKAKITNNFGKI